MEPNTYVTGTVKQWVGVAHLVVQRRNELALSQLDAADLANVSIQTWNHIEKARNLKFRRAITIKIERCLGWKPNSIENYIMHKKEPELDIPAPENEFEMMKARVEQLEAQVAELLRALHSRE